MRFCSACNCRSSRIGRRFQLYTLAWGAGSSQCFLGSVANFRKHWHPGLHLNGVKQHGVCGVEGNAYYYVSPVHPSPQSSFPFEAMEAHEFAYNAFHIRLLEKSAKLWFLQRAPLVSRYIVHQRPQVRPVVNAIFNSDLDNLYTLFQIWVHRSMIYRNRNYIICINK